MARKTKVQKEEAGKAEYPKHVDGKHTGYDILEDGGIRIAPVYQDMFKVASSQENAAKAILEVVVAQCHKLVKESNELGLKTWRDLTEDIGLSPEKQYKYNFSSGTVKEKKEEGMK